MAIVLKPNEEDKNAFLKRVATIRGSPVILSLIAGYNDAYMPLYEAGKLMKPLTDLHSIPFSKLPYPELLQKCEEIYETVLCFRLARPSRLKR